MQTATTQCVIIIIAYLSVFKPTGQTFTLTKTNYLLHHCCTKVTTIIIICILKFK